MHQITEPIESDSNLFLSIPWLIFQEYLDASFLKSLCMTHVILKNCAHRTQVSLSVFIFALIIGENDKLIETETVPEK